MEYIRIPEEKCLCFYEHEPVDRKKLNLFFRYGQTVFVKNKSEKIIGIISKSDYEKCIRDGRIYVNKEFKKILYHVGYMGEVRQFFADTSYQSVPVLNEDGELMEYFIRTEGTAYNIKKDDDKWINIENSHLAKLVRKKGYNRIKICVMDFQSNQIYRYFKHYESLYDSIEKVLWFDVLEMGETDVVIMSENIDLDLDTHIYSFDSLRIELEYNLLLYNCKKNNVKLYMVSIPTKCNVWNITKDERQRILKGDQRTEYFKNREAYSGLFEQVFNVNGGRLSEN